MGRTDRGTPRWHLLLALSAAVLGAHLWLLAGGLPRWPSDQAEVAPVSGPVAAQQPHNTDSKPPQETPHAVRATASTVRWIAPAPGTAPAASPATRPAVAPSPTTQKRLARPSAQASQAPEIAASPVEAAAPTPDSPAPPLQPAQPIQPDSASASADASANLDAAAPAEPFSADAVEASAAEASAPEEPVVVTAAASPRRAAASTPRQQPPARPPGSVNLSYDVTGKSKGITYSADARLSWQPSGTRYTAELEISAFLLGSRIQTSSGRLDAHGLAPERFGDRRRSNEKAAHFDHAGQRIRFSNNAPDTPLLVGAQDRLSVFLQLAALVQARPDAYPAGQSIRLQVAGTGDAEIWQFQVGPEETLELPAGRVSARRLTRPPRREFDNTVVIWLAPALQHLPVRIQITEHNGDVADQRLRHLPPPAP